MTKLSIIIVSHNTRALMDACLKSVAEQTQVRHEVIVVDNNSNDGTPSFIAERHPNVRLVVNSANLGFSTANNQGLQLASGRYRLLLNPDTLVMDRALDHMVRYLDTHTEVGIIGAKMVNADGSAQQYESWRPSLLTYLFNSIMLRMRGDLGSQEVAWVCGACLMIREETMNQIGLLDENIFMFSEDVDWCLRARYAGWKIYHCSEVRVVHLWGESAKRDLAVRVFNGHQAKLYLFKKHYSWLSYVSLKAIMLAEALAKIVYDAVTYVWVDSDRKLIKQSRMRGYLRFVQHLGRFPTFVEPGSMVPFRF